MKSSPLSVFLPFLLSRNLAVNGTDSKCAGIVICWDAQFDIDILGILDPLDRVDIRPDDLLDDLPDDLPGDLPGVPTGDLPDDLLDDLPGDLPTGTVSGICPDHPPAACAANGEIIDVLVLFLEGDIV